MACLRPERTRDGSRKCPDRLGLTASEFELNPFQLSGGYQVRLNLARHLLTDYDLLLLDEPNNYLDITSIRWLEKFLLDGRRIDADHS